MGLLMHVRWSWRIKIGDFGKKSGGGFRCVRKKKRKMQDTLY